MLPLIIFAISCGKKDERIQVIEETDLTPQQIDSVLDEYSFEYSRIVMIDSIEKVILPITTQRSSGSTFPRYSSKFDSEADSYPNYWNFIFYDIKSGSARLLTKKKTRISEFETNFYRVGPLLKKSVLYKLADTDFNKDNKLTSEDPLQLCITDQDGENYRRLSPITEHLVEYHIVPNTDKIIYKTLRDTNNDQKFDVKDEGIWYIIDLSKDSKPIELINTKERKEIENLYFKQWLVKEKEEPAI
ncbi:hypothetical protein DMZ48_08565 [Robertkochia solimangrovi]|nr:hypothetical protein DMZ48_08565 [Robertkochia solimangrovi]